MLLEFVNLKKNYGNKRALKPLNLELSYGIYGLLGPNGAGKSTLMKLICMLLESLGGEIIFNGKNIVKQKKEFLKVLGYMPQHTCLYPEFTVLEYLYYIGALKGISKRKVERQSNDLLKKVKLLDVKNQKIKTLSGGMQQRLMFAQSLIGSPKVIILDEPTAGLDPKKRIEMRNLIAENAKDKIIIIATHVVSDVELIADEILLLNKGVLIAKDTVEGLTDDIYGKVYEIEVEEDLERLQEKYNVSQMYNRKGKTYAKVIVGEDTEIYDGQIVYPDLEDVYLYHFGQEEG